MAAPCNLPVPIPVPVRDVAVNWSSGRPWKNARREMCTSSGAKAAVTLIPLPLEKMTGLGNRVAANLRSPIQKSRTANTRPRIQHIADALVAEGCVALDKQAKALGVHRSTAWTIMRTKHKLDRLSLKTTNRILASPELPPSVRIIVLQYLAERSDGLYSAA